MKGQSTLSSRDSNAKDDRYHGGIVAYDFCKISHDKVCHITYKGKSTKGSSIQ